MQLQPAVYGTQFTKFPVVESPEWRFGTDAEPGGYPLLVASRIIQPTVKKEQLKTSAENCSSKEKRDGADRSAKKHGR